MAINNPKGYLYGMPVFETKDYTAGTDIARMSFGDTTGDTIWMAKPSKQILKCSECRKTIATFYGYPQSDAKCKTCHQIEKLTE